MGEGAPFSGRGAGPRTGSLLGGEECRQSPSMPQLSSEVKTGLLWVCVATKPNFL